MCDQTEVEYKPGEVVWCKLSNLWWPAQVQDQNDLDEDVTHGLKKKPLAVVKFFKEDYYDFVKDINQICSYNSPKKDEFIKKGMDSYRALGETNKMNKFPEDVVTAEEMTGGNVNILDDPKFAPEEKINYKNLFTPLKVDGKNGKKGKGSGAKSKVSMGCNVVSAVRLNGSVECKKKYFSKDLVQKSNGGSGNEYECSLCGFVCSRISCLYQHIKYNKGNICCQIVSKKFIKSPSFVKLEKSCVKRKWMGKDGPVGKKKAKTGPNRSPASAAQPVKQIIKVKTLSVKEIKEKDKRKCEAMREQLLLDWNEEDPEDDDTHSPLGASSIAPYKLQNTNLLENKTSCFDFEENEEDMNVERNVRFGQKLPRVIPKDDKSSKENKSKEKGMSMSDDDALEIEFNNIMKETSVAAVVPIVSDSFLSDSSVLPGSSGKTEKNLGLEAIVAPIQYGHEANRAPTPIHIEMDSCQKSDDDNASLLRALQCDSPAEPLDSQTDQLATSNKRSGSSLCENVMKKLKSDKELLESLRSDSDDNSCSVDNNNLILGGKEISLIDSTDNTCISASENLVSPSKSKKVSNKSKSINTTPKGDKKNQSIQKTSNKEIKDVKMLHRSSHFVKKVNSGDKTGLRISPKLQKNRQKGSPNKKSVKNSSESEEALCRRSMTPLSGFTKADKIAKKHKVLPSSSSSTHLSQIKNSGAHQLYRKSKRSSIDSLNTTSNELSASVGKKAVNLSGFERSSKSLLKKPLKIEIPDDEKKLEDLIHKITCDSPDDKATLSVGLKEKKRKHVSSKKCFISDRDEKLVYKLCNKEVPSKDKSPNILLNPKSVSNKLDPIKRDSGSKKVISKSTCSVKDLSTRQVEDSIKSDDQNKRLLVKNAATAKQSKVLDNNINKPEKSPLKTDCRTDKIAFSSEPKLKKESKDEKSKRGNQSSLLSSVKTKPELKQSRTNALLKKTNKDIVLVKTSPKIEGNVPFTRHSSLDKVIVRPESNLSKKTIHHKQSANTSPVSSVNKKAVLTSEKSPTKTGKTKKLRRGDDSINDLFTPDIIITVKPSLKTSGDSSDSSTSVKRKDSLKNTCLPKDKTITNKSVDNRTCQQLSKTSSVGSGLCKGDTQIEVNTPTNDSYFDVSDSHLRSTCVNQETQEKSANTQLKTVDIEEIQLPKMEESDKKNTTIQTDVDLLSNMERNVAQQPCCLSKEPIHSLSIVDNSSTCVTPLALNDNNENLVKLDSNNEKIGDVDGAESGVNVELQVGNVLLPTAKAGLSMSHDYIDPDPDPDPVQCKVTLDCVPGDSSSAGHVPPLCLENKTSVMSSLQSDVNHSTVVVKDSEKLIVGTLSKKISQVNNGSDKDSVNLNDSLDILQDLCSSQSPVQPSEDIITGDLGKSIVESNVTRSTETHSNRIQHVPSEVSFSDVVGKNVDTFSCDNTLVEDSSSCAEPGPSMSGGDVISESCLASEIHIETSPIESHKDLKQIVIPVDGDNSASGIADIDKEKRHICDTSKSISDSFISTDNVVCSEDTIDREMEQMFFDKDAGDEGPALNVVKACEGGDVKVSSCQSSSDLTGVSSSSNSSNLEQLSSLETQQQVVAIESTNSEHVLTRDNTSEIMQNNSSEITQDNTCEKNVSKIEDSVKMEKSFPVFHDGEMGFEKTTCEVHDRANPDQCVNNSVSVLGDIDYIESATVVKSETVVDGAIKMSTEKKNLTTPSILSFSNDFFEEDLWTLEKEKNTTSKLCAEGTDKEVLESKENMVLPVPLSEGTVTSLDEKVNSEPFVNKSLNIDEPSELPLPPDELSANTYKKESVVDRNRVLVSERSSVSECQVAVRCSSVCKVADQVHLAKSLAEYSKLNKDDNKESDLETCDYDKVKKDSESYMCGLDSKFDVVSEVVITSETTDASGPDDESNLYNFEDQVGVSGPVPPTPHYSPPKQKPKTFGNLKINLSKPSNMLISLAKEFPSKVMSADFLTPDKIKAIFSKKDEGTGVAVAESCLMKPIIVPPQALLEDKPSSVVSGSVADSTPTLASPTKTQVPLFTADLQNMKLDINSMPIVIADSNELVSSVDPARQDSVIVTTSCHVPKISLATTSVASLVKPAMTQPLRLTATPFQKGQSSINFDLYIKFVKHNKFKLAPNSSYKMFSIPGKNILSRHSAHHTNRIVKFFPQKRSGFPSEALISGKELYIMTIAGKKQVIFSKSGSSMAKPITINNKSEGGPVTQRSIVVTVDNSELPSSCAGRSKVHGASNSRTVQLVNRRVVTQKPSHLHTSLPVSVGTQPTIKVIPTSSVSPLTGKIINVRKIQVPNEPLPRKRVQFREPEMSKSIKIPSILGSRRPSLLKKSSHLRNEQTAVKLAHESHCQSLTKVQEGDATETSQLIVSTKDNLDCWEQSSKSQDTSVSSGPKQDIVAKALGDILQDSEESSSMSNYTDQAMFECSLPPTCLSISNPEVSTSHLSSNMLQYNLSSQLIQPSMPLLTDELLKQTVASSSEASIYQLDCSQLIVTSPCQQTSTVTAGINLAEIQLPPGEPDPVPVSDISSIPLPPDDPPPASNQLLSPPSSTLPQSFQTTSNNNLSAIFQSVANS